MFKLAVIAGSAAVVSAWHPVWKSKPSWYGEEVGMSHSEIVAQQDEGNVFPLHPKQLDVFDYKWSKTDQRAQVETSKGAVYFRRYIAQEVFAAQLAEYLGICVARTRYVPWGSKVSHAWQDVIQDVTQHITPDNVARVQYLFEDQAGVQEVEFIDGAVVQGYQAKHGYDKILFDVGKLFAFDMFINDPHNCRYCECNHTAGHYWTCRDGEVFNFIISPTKGVCGYTRAYKRLDITSGEGQKFRQFFQLARSKETTTELSRQLAYVAGDMFGENLTMDRREAAEMLLKGARWSLLRINELHGEVFRDLTATSGLHQSFEFGLGERLRMVRIILGEEIDAHEADTRHVEVNSDYNDHSKVPRNKKDKYKNTNTGFKEVTKAKAPKAKAPKAKEQLTPL